MTEGTTVHTTTYRDGFQYDDGTLDFFPHAEGEVQVTYGQYGLVAYNYVFHYTDHLGNIRVRYAQDPDDGVLKILEEKHYYPFGLQHTGYNSGQKSFSKIETSNSIALTPVNPFLGDTYKYGYNGKEKQEELGLDLLDYGNRNYDAALGRFITIDRYTQKYLDKSPYHYGANNPILYADKAGDSIIVSTNERLYDGIDGNRTNVPSEYYTGQTYLASTSWVYNETTKEIDATFYIQQNFTPFLVPGSNNRFTQKNPGIRPEIFAHEDGHRDQFSESIINSTDFSVKLDTHEGEKRYGGGVQDILDAIYSDYEINLTNALEEIKTDNPFKLTEDEVKADEKAKLDVNINNALNSISEDVKNRLTRFNQNDPGHSDANNRSYQYLGGERNSKYNSGRKSIVFWGNN